MGEIIDYKNISICNAILVRYTNYWTKNRGKNYIFSAIWQLTVEQNYRIAKLRKVMLGHNVRNNRLSKYINLQCYSSPLYQLLEQKRG